MSKLQLEILEARICAAGDGYRGSPYYWATVYAARVKPIEISTVAIVDTGLAMRDKTFKNHLWTNWDEWFGVWGKDDDGNGLKDDIRSWDFAAIHDIFGPNIPGARYGDNLAFDENGHGTHVAGIVLNTAASYNKYLYLMPVRVLDRFGGGNGWDVAKGIVYAVQQGAAVINVSLGSYQFDWDVYLAVSYANAHGRLVVAAAGNSRADIRTSGFYPASIWGVISVAALNKDGSGLASFSNFGAQIATHGEDIESNLPGESTGKKSGTSMASPKVAAAAAILWLEHRSWNSGMVRARLYKTADSFDPTILRGMLDIDGALGR